MDLMGGGYCRGYRWCARIFVSGGLRLGRKGKASTATLSTPCLVPLCMRAGGLGFVLEFVLAGGLFLWRGFQSLTSVDSYLRSLFGVGDMFFS